MLCRSCQSCLTQQQKRFSTVKLIVACFSSCLCLWFSCMCAHRCCVLLCLGVCLQVGVVFSMLQRRAGSEPLGAYFTCIIYLEFKIQLICLQCPNKPPAVLRFTNFVVVTIVCKIASSKLVRPYVNNREEHRKKRLNNVKYA